MSTKHTPRGTAFVCRKYREEKDSGFIDFAAAIIKQAKKDYREDAAYREEVEKFFLSEYGQILCYGHGEEIVRQLREEVANEEY